MKRFFIYIFLIILIANKLSAQDYLLFKAYSDLDLKNYYKSDSAFHSALNSTAFCTKSIYEISSEKHSDKKWFHRKLLYEHFGIAEGKNYVFYIDPLFDFSLSKSYPDNKNMYVNTRAVQVYANLYNKLSISSSIYENQAKFPEFIDDFYNYFGVIPGHDRVKPYGNGGYDWGNAYATVSYKATKFLHFELGNDKNFIGNGYRSMILSDFSPQYLYFKTSVFWKKFFYTNIAGRTYNPKYNNVLGYTENWSTNYLYPHKFLNINYFGANINEKLQVGLFEASMMRINSKLSPKFTAWLPLVNEFAYIYLDDLFFLWGMDLKFEVYKNLNIYSQAIPQLNRSYATKIYATQLGMSYLYESSVGNFFIRGEWNYASRHMYEGIFGGNYWGHFRQALAHPAGNNFNEFLGQITWQHKRYYVFAQFGQIKYLKGIKSRDIFHGSLVLDDDACIITSAALRLSYLVNPAYSWHVFASVNYWHNSSTDKKYLIPSIGMKTFLRNNYLDF